ncbi:DinB family protein [Aureibacillus halotolerans]|uniref:DinB family protein n=1 Tax=Aureibacillus halotolerans TaxID=1508390 RepID=A0A4R6TWZ1_9BACI|nr:DinB family protein [Aureibacillus halotolerans]TDQ33722.1 DinB family protein [Aureibacillus halotolerans]
MLHTLISTATTVRQMVIGQLEAMPNEVWDVQPDGFKNTIHWNAGHIVFCSEYFLSTGIKVDQSLIKTYAPFFNTGTSPSEWNANAPGKEEFLEQLKRQMSLFSDISSDTFETPLEPALQIGPLTFRTFGEAFNFSTVHETLHSATISCMLKTLQHKSA